MKRQRQDFEMNNMPIRYKLIVHFLLISILPAIGLGLLVSWTADKIIERQVNDNTLQLISKVNKTLEFYVSSLQNMTYLIAFNPAVQQFMDGGNEALPPNKDYEIRQLLQGFTTLHTEVSGILVTNTDGAYISNELYTRSVKSLKEEAWFQDAVANKGLFKVLGHPSGRNLASHANYQDDEVISVVRAVLDPETQELQGVILIDLKLRVIAETAKDVRLGKSGYLMVVDDRGENIYAPKQAYLGQVPVEWLDREGQGGSFSRKIEGEPLQFIYQRSAFTGWTVVGVFSSRDTVLEVREINFYLISFVFMVCLLGIAASLYLSHSLSRPIVQLKTLMLRAESGDLNSRYNGTRRDEIGMLGRSFNAMISQIGKLLALMEEQSRQKREAEFRSLQAQIKPHFLYNTLDTIHWMARKDGTVEMAELVDSLSKLFRIGLNRGSDQITLTNEMEHIASYLRIQKIRYKDKLNYELEMEEQLRDYWVLKLILQPVVENAIYHGIKERRGPGRIRIHVERAGGMLLLRVQDDGKGIPPDKLELLQRHLEEGELPGAGGPDGGQSEMETEGSGYGLLNIQARIRLTFGDAYGLSIESKLGEGTTVTIRHPLLQGQEHHQSWRGSS